VDAFFDSPTRDRSGVVRDMLHMQTETWKAAAKGWAGYARRRCRPTTTPLHVMADGMKWWWTMMDREEPQWASPNEVMWDSGIAKLRDFSQGSRKRVVPTLSLPPQAGHHSCIVDYLPEQSQLRAVRTAGLERAYAIEWLGVTKETKDVTIDDYLAVIDRAVEDLGGKVNLIGNCQGGWLSTMWAALNPERVNTLIVGGAPIDTHAGNSVVAKYKHIMTPGGRIGHYRLLVKAGRGILPGPVMLISFIAMKPQNEVSKQLGLLAHLDDPEYVAHYAEFEDWYRYTVPLPGKVYLWAIEHLFLSNGLAERRHGDRRPAARREQDQGAALPARRKPRPHHSRPAGLRARRPRRHAAGGHREADRARRPHRAVHRARLAARLLGPDARGRRGALPSRAGGQEAPHVRPRQVPRRGGLVI